MQLKTRINKLITKNYNYLTLKGTRDVQSGKTTANLNHVSPWQRQGSGGFETNPHQARPLENVTRDTPG
jgi:hypothetical protein